MQRVHTPLIEHAWAAEGKHFSVKIKWFLIQNPSQWGDHQRTSSSIETTINNLWPLCSLDYAVCRRRIPAVANAQSCSAPRSPQCHLSTDGCMYNLHEQTYGPPLCKLQQALSYPAAGPIPKPSAFCREAHTAIQTQRGAFANDLALQAFN